MLVDENIKAQRNIIIEAMGRAIGVYGMNETIGRIYGFLYFEEEPTSLNKIADELGVSKATVSINIRILLDLKMVQKVWQKGSRKDFYIAETDFVKIVREVLNSKEKAQIIMLKEAINQAVSEYEEIKTDDLEDDITQQQAYQDIQKLEELYKWIDTSEKWINFLLEHTLEDEPSAELTEIKVEWDDQL